MILVGSIIFVICVIAAWKWVDGLDFMQEFHPDYDGEDFP
jgi:hypothetical protein